MKIEITNVCRELGPDLNRKSIDKKIETNDVSMKTRSNGNLYITVESPTINKEVNKRIQIVLNDDEIRRIGMITTLWG